MVDLWARRWYSAHGERIVDRGRADGSPVGKRRSSVHGARWNPHGEKGSRSVDEGRCNGCLLGKGTKERTMKFRRRNGTKQRGWGNGQ